MLRPDLLVIWLLCTDGSTLPCLLGCWASKAKQSVAVSSVLISLQVGDYERAVEDYSQALLVDPQNSYAYYNRGITRDRSGDYEGAIADFSQAIRLDPANADFFHNRGFSLRKMVGTLHSADALAYIGDATHPQSNAMPLHNSLCSFKGAQLVTDSCCFPYTAFHHLCLCRGGMKKP